MTDLVIRDIFAQLKAFHAAPDTPVNLLKIGPPLVAAGYSEDQIVNALFSLERQKIIALSDNRVVVLKPL